MHRSELTVALGAVRRNARTLLRTLEGAQLWAVVKADAYGHGAVGVGAAGPPGRGRAGACAPAAVEVRAALRGVGAGALCVAPVAEGLELRQEFSLARILVMGPTASSREIAEAREARLELAVWDEELPEGVRVHLKLDTGMGRWGLSELPSPRAEVVGLMSHLATADSDPAFAEEQVERFRQATAPYSYLMRHVANSAGALRLPSSRFDAARCGVALYGLSPFDEDRAADGLEPALSWRSHLAQVKRLEPGESTGYGRRFVAEAPTWIGLGPVGYADGFRRDLTGTEVRVGGEARRVVGGGSLGAFAREGEHAGAVGGPPP